MITFIQAFGQRPEDLQLVDRGERIFSKKYS